MSIITTGTVLRSQAPGRDGLASTYERYAVHAGEQGWIALTSNDAELSALLGFKVAAIEEDPEPPKPLTARQRWNLAIKAIRASGVAFQQNIAGCCNGCSEPFKGVKSFDRASTPAGWFIAAQDQGVRWHADGLAVIPKDYTSWDQEKAVYINHANGSAARIAQAFRDQGFNVSWGGTDAESVRVAIPARRKSRWED